MVPVIIGELRELQSGSRTALREAGRGASCKSGTCAPQGRLQSHIDSQTVQCGVLDQEDVHGKYIARVKAEYCSGKLPAREGQGL